MSSIGRSLPRFRLLLALFAFAFLAALGGYVGWSRWQTSEFLRRGEEALEARNDDSAREQFERYLAARPNDPRGRLLAARAARRLHLYAEAWEHLRLGRANAIEMEPLDVHYQLGLCLEQLGKAEEAKSHMVQFKRIEADLVRMEQLLGEIVKKPQEASLRREIGLICLRNGQIDEGLRWLYGVLETAPHDRETNEALADFFHSKGDLDRSVQHRRQIR